MTTKLNVLQVIPKLGYGGAETGCYDIAHFLSENDCLNLHYRMIIRNYSRYDSLGVKLQNLFFSLFDDFVGSGGARELIRLSIESSCNDLWI